MANKGLYLCWTCGVGYKACKSLKVARAQNLLSEVAGWQICYSVQDAMCVTSFQKKEKKKKALLGQTLPNHPLPLQHRPSIRGRP